MTVFGSVTIRAIPDIPLVTAGQDVGAVIAAAAARAGLAPQDGDVLVVAQKIVSKAEGRMVPLAGVEPSARARDLARTVNKDPRLVELILAESTEVVACRKDVLIVAHRLGFVMANAGIDQSYVGPSPAGETDCALLLPEDPDASARAIRDRIQALTGSAVAVVVNDSFGRAWRRGTTGHAIGVAGLLPLRNCVGQPDLFGRKLQSTEVAVADELAAAASLVMGQGDEGAPAVLIRGAAIQPGAGGIGPLLRPKAEDLFR